MAGLDLPAHPGRDVREEKALDFVFLGHAPAAPKAVVERLIRDGLLLRRWEWRRDFFGAFEVPRYSLPDDITRRVEDYYAARTAGEEGT